MPLITVSHHIVLRFEPGFQDPYLAYNTKTFDLLRLTNQQFALMEVASQQPINKIDFIEMWEKTFLIDKRPMLTVDDLLNLGFILEDDKGFQLRTSRNFDLFKPMSSFSTRIPVELELCITRRCNLACVHCNVSAHNSSYSQELPGAFWIDLLKQCEDRDIFHVTVTGGEPFLHHDWDIILGELCKRRLSVHLLTNGTLMSESQISEMAEAGMVLSVSLDGSTASVHDQFRGVSGAFNKTISNLRLMHKHGLLFVVTAVLNTTNLPYIYDMVELFTEIGASKIVFAPMTKVGRGASAKADSFIPNSVELDNITARLRKIHSNKSGPELVVGERNQTATFVSFSNSENCRCKAGFSLMSVDEDGIVYPCLRGLQTRTNPIADLKSESFYSAWSSKKFECFRALEPLQGCHIERMEINGSYTLDLSSTK